MLIGDDQNMFRTKKLKRYKCFFIICHYEIIMFLLSSHDFLNKTWAYRIKFTARTVVYKHLCQHKWFSRRICIRIGSWWIKQKRFWLHKHHKLSINKYNVIAWGVYLEKDLRKWVCHQICKEHSYFSEVWLIFLEILSKKAS